MRWARTYLLTAILLFSLPSLPTCGSPTSKKPQPGPQYCFATFAQAASVQINTATPRPETQTLPSYCFPQRGVKFGKITSGVVSLMSGTASVSVQPFAQRFTIALDQIEPVIIDNCAGNNNLQETLQITKTFQPGVLVASNYYIADPLKMSGDFDAIAHTLFSAYAYDIASYKPTTFATPIVEVKPHTKIQLDTFWTEIYAGGLATETQAGGTVIGNLSFAVPLQMSINTAKQNKSQPHLLECPTTTP